MLAQSKSGVMPEILPGAGRLEQPESDSVLPGAPPAIEAQRLHEEKGMAAADFNELSESEKWHFYKCQHCGEIVDKLQLDDVLFHEDHVHRPDIQYGGSERLGESKQ